MTAVLPWLFIGLGGLLLLASLAALWQSLRAAFGMTSVGAVQGVTDSEERANLLDEKTALLQSIRDLELDHDSGKISDADFERLNARLRAQARDVLQMLDEEVEAYRPMAESLVKEAVKKTGLTPYRSAALATPAPAGPEEGEASPGAEAGEAEGEAAASEEPLGCADCGTHNDPDAVFCKKCGSRLGSGEGGAS